MNNSQEIFGELNDRYHMDCLNWTILSMSARVDVSDQTVLGWDIVARQNGTCYSFYTAEPPLIGYTPPVTIPIPLGLAVFNSWNLNYQQAVSKVEELFGTVEFSRLSLYRPLYPGVENPSWHIHTVDDREFAVDAITGVVESYERATMPNW